MRILKLLPALLLLAAASIHSQEEPAAPFAWKVEGDTAETFKVSLEPNIEIDRSSPEALVRTFMALSDGRAPDLETLDAAINKIERAELKDPLAMLDESLRSLPLPEDKQELFGGSWDIEVRKPRFPLPPTKDKDSRFNQDEPTEATVDVVRTKAEEYDGIAIANRHCRFRFQCIRQEAGVKSWRISKIRRDYKYDTWPLATSPVPTPEPEQLDLRPFVVLPYDPGFAKAAQWEVALAQAAVEFEGDVHPAVRAFCNDILLPRLVLRTKLVLRCVQAHLQAIEPLLSTEFVAELRGDQANSTHPLNPEFHTVKQLEQSDLGDGRVGVLIQKDDLFQTSWRFELSPDGDDWHIDAIKQRFIATRVRDGKQVETLRDADSFWDVAKTDAPSILGTPMFLRR